MIGLTEEEMAFLNSNPVIRVGNEMDWAPYDYMEDGHVRGISPEFLNIITEMLDVEIEWVNGYTWDELLSKLESREIDMVLNAAPAVERESYMSLSKAYLNISYGYITQKNSDLDHPGLVLEDKRIAVIEDYYYTEQILEVFDSLIPIYVETPQKAYEAVLEGDVDLYADDFNTLSYLQESGLPHGTSIYPLPRISNEIGTELGFGVRKDWLILTQIINKAMIWISSEEIDNILSEYFLIGGTSQQRNISLMNHNVLTQEEIEWLLNHRTLNVYSVDNLPPISFHSDEEIYSGIARGFMNALENRLGISFTYSEEGGNIPQALESISDSSIHLISCLAYSENRSGNLLFTEPFLDLPIGVYSRNEHMMFFQNPESLENSRVVAIGGHAVFEFMKGDYPDVEILPVSGILEGLKSVNNRSADVYLGEIYVTNRILAENHLNNVSHIGKLPYSYRISLGINKDYPILESILNKSLREIKEEQGMEIEVFWLSQKVDQKINPLTIMWFSIIVAVSAFIIFLQFRNSRAKHSIMVKLGKSENRYRLLAEKTTDVIWTCGNESSGYTMKYINPACQTIFGFTPEEYLQLPFDKRIYPESMDFFQKQLSILNREKKDITFEIKHYNSKGNPMDCEILITPLLDSSGEISGYQGRLIDISDRKKMEQVVMQNNSLETLGQFASGVAHDFNNSLESILGNIELILSDHTMDSNTISIASQMKKSISDAAARVKQLQKFTSREKYVKKDAPISLKQIVNDVFIQTKPLWKDMAEKDGLEFTIQTSISPDHILMGDESELRSVLYNLVKNSIEAMPHGGLINVYSKEEKGTISIFVEDRGIGMDQETAAKVFQPFFSTKGFAQGRGLGMSAVYGVIANHRGTIEIVRTELGQGTTIEIRLPASKTKEIANREEEPRKTAERTLRILWVDDEEIIRTLGQKRLKKLNHLCEIAPGGAEALEMIKQKSFDLVITDIGMPGMNGWELADRIRREINTDVPIAILSGWGAQQFEEEKEKYRVDYILGKPIKQEDLISLLQDVMEKGFRQSPQ